MQHITISRTSWLLCASVFLISIVMQGYFWYGYEFVDEMIWIPTVTAYAHDAAWNATSETVTSTALAYPATTILIPASQLIRLHVIPIHALQITLALLLSLITAAIALVAYTLRPNSWWWAALSSLFITNRLYQSATLPSAVMIPFGALFALLCILVYERPQSKWALLSLGAATGLMLATRLDISLAFIVCAIVLLLSRRRFRDTAILITTTIAVFILAGPFWLLSPREYFSLYIALLHFSTQVMSPAVVGWKSFFGKNTAPYMALAALIIVPLMNFFEPPTRRPLAFPLLWWLVLMTLAIVSALLISSGEQVRYFFPLYAIWDSLFALYVLELIKNMSLPNSLHGLRTRMLPLLFIVFMIVAQLPDSFLYGYLLQVL